MRWSSLIGVGFVLSGALLAQQEIADKIRTAQSAGDYSSAANLYLRLIAAGTDSPQIRSNCGIMLHLAGKNREALDQFRIALERDPTLIGPNLFAGLAELDLGRPKEALPFLERAKEQEAQSAAPLLALGKAYGALRQFESAHESYIQASVKDPGLAEAWYGVGITARSLAEQKLNRAARAGNPSPEEAKQLLEQTQKALNRALELDPNSPRGHLILAESLRDSGKLVEAVQEYQTTIKLDPKMEAAYLGLATSYWKNRQFDDALPLLHKVLEKWPKDPEANGMMADILEREGNYPEARRHARLALEGNPDLIETRIVLARVYLAEQQPKLAIDQLQKVLGADQDGSYHFLLYRAYKQAGDSARAKSTLLEYQERKYAGPPKEK